MMILGLIILSFFALLGLLSFASALIGRAYREYNPSTLVLRKLNAESAEVRVRCAAARCVELRCGHLLCECADEEALFICKKLMHEYPIIEAVMAEKAQTG